ncbi:MAG: hypothetical protein NC336_04670 [Clostridium sp.]|nr:hypothetical protein [Clostridium sp.]
MPSEPLRVAAIPLAPAEGEVDLNLAAAREAVARAAADGCDLAVLPEMFNSAFTENEAFLRRIAEPDDGPTMTAVAGLAAEFDLAVAGSFTAVDPATGRLYNRGFIRLPDGPVSFYDKRHLFIIGGERKVLTAGTALAPVVGFRSWRLRLSICYDIRFPVWNRRVASGPDDYDLLIVPANWPVSRSYAWRQMLIARAIENQVCVVGADRSGSDVYGSYAPADTVIYDQAGTPVGTDDGGIVRATLDPVRLEKYRNHFPVWHDADRFSIEY